MKQTSRLLVLLFVLALPLAAFSQESGPAAYEEWPDALGAFGSSLAGHGGGGLHWQHWSGRLGLALTLGGIYQPDNSWGLNLLDYSATATLQYRVYGEDFSRWLSGQLYLWASAGHLGYIPQTYDSSGAAIIGAYVPDALAGLGLGIELIAFRHFSLPIEFGYMVQFPFYTALQVSFGGGLRYRY